MKISLLKTSRIQNTAVTANKKGQQLSNITFPPAKRKRRSCFNSHLVSGDHCNPYVDQLDILVSPWYQAFSGRNELNKGIIASQSDSFIFIVSYPLHIIERKSVNDATPGLIV